LETLIQCRVPANLQENAIAGAVIVSGSDDLVPDNSADVNLWESLELEIFQGGTGSTPNYGAAMASGGTIQLGEHVKLEITSNSLNLDTDYKLV